VSNIPSIIFQTWKTKTELPASLAYWSQTVQALHPKYTYRLWAPHNNRAFVAAEFPWFVETFDGLETDDERLLATRYLFLYLYGGCSLDMDVQALSPLDVLLPQGGIQIGQTAQGVSSAVILSAPRQEFWLFVIGLMMRQTAAGALTLAIKQYREEYRDDNVQMVIGKVRSLLDDAHMASRDKTEIDVKPHRLFLPLDDSDRIHRHFILDRVHEDGPLNELQCQTWFNDSVTVKYYWWEEPED
jgi:hypothetical protein